MSIRVLFSTLLVLSAFISPYSCAAQSSFCFFNSGGIDAPVFDASGNRLFGSNYVAMLYGGSNPNSLVPAIEAIPPLGQVITPTPFTQLYNGQPGYFFYRGFQGCTVIVPS